MKGGIFMSGVMLMWRVCLVICREKTPVRGESGTGGRCWSKGYEHDWHADSVSASIR